MDKEGTVTDSLTAVIVALLVIKGPSKYYAIIIWDEGE
jgi:hypothetical protein